MTRSVNLLKQDPVHVTLLAKASRGAALPQIFPVAYKTVAGLTCLCLFVLTLSHLLLSTPSSSPAAGFIPAVSR